MNISLLRRTRIPVLIGAGPPKTNPVMASALTFLTLAIWIGPDRALFFIMLAAIATVWFWLCGVGFASGGSGRRGYYGRTVYRRRRFH
jgi:hypothetical protein